MDDVCVICISSFASFLSLSLFTHPGHEYYVARQSTVVFKNHIDWLRLLGYMLVLFVPVCVAGCGFIGWFWKKPLVAIMQLHASNARAFFYARCTNYASSGFLLLSHSKISLYMGMCSFSIMAIFFVMTGIQLIPAMLISDQCVDFDGFLTENFNRFGLSPNASAPWVYTTEDTKAGAIFQYFSSCDNPRPELLNAFANPSKILAENNINFTNYKEQVERNLAENNNIIVLQDVVWSYFNQLDLDTQNIVSKKKVKTCMRTFVMLFNHSSFCSLVFCILF
jgi:hypothetical protein